MSKKSDPWPPGFTLRGVIDGKVFFGNRQSGDLAIIPDAGGWRVAEYADAEQQTVAWGDVQMPKPPGTYACCKFYIGQGAGKHRGEWFATLEECRETLRPYLLMEVK